MTDAEAALVADIAERQDELVELLSDLIAFDTTTHTDGAPPRHERRLQQYLGDRLARRGASVEIGEPESSVVADHPMIPEGFTFAGRPQLVARFAGSGGGPTLLLNGHVDVVDVAPRDGWQTDPFCADVRDGAVYGRGACDMKGGVACMAFAAEAIARAGMQLGGELIVNTVTDEESTGAGGLAMARTLRADAAIVPEPSGLDVLIACRGSLLPSIDVEGRAGHAGIGQPHHSRGGAVNAIEKAAYVIEAVRRLREDWATRYRHPYLSAPDCVPTVIAGGEWLVSYPARCRIDLHIEYLPAQGAADGSGGPVMREFERWIAAAAAADPWLAQHPPRVRWLVGAVPPAEVSPEEPIVGLLRTAAGDLGRASELAGLDNWHDGASLILEGGIPAVCFGPGDVRVAHTIDEQVPIDDLVACAQAIALAAVRFCGHTP